MLPGISPPPPLIYFLIPSECYPLPQPSIFSFRQSVISMYFPIPSECYFHPHLFSHTVKVLPSPPPPHLFSHTFRVLPPPHLFSHTVRVLLPPPPPSLFPSRQSVTRSPIYFPIPSECYPL